MQLGGSMLSFIKKDSYNTNRKLSFFSSHDFSLIDILFLMAGLGFCFFTMYYWDITVTSRFSLTFIDSLFDGKLLSFYDNALASGVAPEGAVYDIGIYIIFAIWGLPVWILHKILGIDPMSIGCLLWFKILLLVFVVGTIYELRKIMDELGYQKQSKDWASIIYLSSSTLVFPVLVAAQYDIVPLFFIMLGILYYLKEKNKAFFVCFAVAMTTKPFAALPVVALILLKEKRIMRVLLGILCSATPMLVMKILYSFNEGYRESCGGFLTMMLPSLLRVSINFGSGAISLFMLGLIGIYIFCYAWRKTNDTVFNGQIVILVVAGIWTVFCLFANMNPYWVIYLAPFLVMVVFMNKHNMKLSLLLDIIFNVSLTIIFILKFTWVYGGTETFSYLILKPIYNNLIGMQEGVTVAGILRKLLLEDLTPFFGAAMAASVLVIFLYAIIGLRTKSYEKAEGLEIWQIRIRIAFLYGWIFLCLAALVFGSMGY